MKALNTIQVKKLIQCMCMCVNELCSHLHNLHPRSLYTSDFTQTGYTLGKSYPWLVIIVTLQYVFVFLSAIVSFPTWVTKMKYGTKIILKKKKNNRLTRRSQKRILSDQFSPLCILLFFFYNAVSAAIPSKKDKLGNWSKRINV